MQMVIAQDDLEQQVERDEIALIGGIGIALLLIDSESVPTTCLHTSSMREKAP